MACGARTDVRSRCARDARPWIASRSSTVGRWCSASPWPGCWSWRCWPLLIALLARQAGTEQAIESARQVTWVTARGIVEPRLTPEVMAGDPAALTAFNDAMQKYVMQRLAGAGEGLGRRRPHRLLRRDPADRADVRPRRRGARGTARAEHRLRDQRPDPPENEFERPYEKLLEVYVGVAVDRPGNRCCSRRTSATTVCPAGQAEWRKFAPAALGGADRAAAGADPVRVVTGPAAAASAAGPDRLLQHAVDASDAERRRIAGDLHDGVVQELTGADLHPGRGAGSVRRMPQRDARPGAPAAARLRRSHGQLRSLLVDIYPPSLAEEGLPASLTELASRPGADRDRRSSWTSSGADAIYRRTRGACCSGRRRRCCATSPSHSGAQHVELTATVADGRATLVVDDDGRGFVDRRPARPAGRRATSGCARSATWWASRRTADGAIGAGPGDPGRDP